MSLFKGVSTAKFSLFKILLSYFCCFILTQSCSQKEGGFLTELPFKDIIIITSGNTVHRGISAYDLNGKLIKAVTDFRTDGGIPRSTVHIGNGVLLTSQDSPDIITQYDFKTATKKLFVGTNYFSGGIYGMAKDSRGNIYVAESSNIEKFDSSGARKPLPTSTAFIEGALGSCNINNARRLFITKDDVLIIASYTNGNIIAIDVSTDVPVCLTSVNVGATVNGVILHSNGDLYFSRFTGDSIYRASADGSGAVVVWTGDTSKIDNPTDIAEMPDGTLLVAGFSNHQIWRLNEDGTEHGVNPFISDGQTLSIRDIEIVVGVDE